MLIKRVREEERNSWFQTFELFGSHFFMFLFVYIFQVVPISKISRKERISEKIQNSKAFWINYYLEILLSEVTEGKKERTMQTKPRIVGLQRKV